MAEQLVAQTERVVSRKKKSKSLWDNIPFLKKFKNLRDSCGGVVIGAILVVAGFALIWMSVKSVKEYSKVVASLNMQDSQSVKDKSGLVKISGKPSCNKENKLTYNLCEDYSWLEEDDGQLDVETDFDEDSPETIDEDDDTKDEAFEDSENNLSWKDEDTEDGNTENTELDDDYLDCYVEGKEVTLNNVIYYSITYERYEQVEEKETETREITENGETYEEEVEKTKVVEKWVEKDSKTQWFTFKIGNITITPNDDTKLVADVKETVVENVYIPNDDIASPYVAGYENQASKQVGKTRATIKYITCDNDLIVVGNISNKEIRDGGPFIISNFSDQKLVQELQSDEKTSRLVMGIVSWLALTIGFTLLIGPILAILDFIPLIGGLAKSVLFFINAIIAAVLVMLGVFVVKYWWLLILLFIGLVTAIAVFVLRKQKKKDS